MPATEILVFRAANGRIPMEDWLDFLPTKARAKCLHYMRLLAASGHELRRPIRNGIPSGWFPRRFDMSSVRRFESDTLQYFWDRYVGDDPERVSEYEKCGADIEVAQLIYDMRTDAGLTQRQLAKKVGTTASVICRLEDADYEGHSLAMLRRIAEALGKRIEIRFVPAAKGKGPRSRKVA
jgi:DNA-binding XRE family transcriptional regulator